MRKKLAGRGTNKTVKAKLDDIAARLGKIEHDCELFALKRYVDQMFARIAELEAHQPD